MAKKSQAIGKNDIKNCTKRAKQIIQKETDAIKASTPLRFGVRKGENAVIVNDQQNAIKASQINRLVHRDIISEGKLKAWNTMQSIMDDPETRPALRLKAAMWILEAAGEGIGATRINPSSHKDIHQMGADELMQVIAEQRARLGAMIEGEAIDVTPRKPGRPRKDAAISTH